jgi:hypothetical protein
MVQPSGKQLRKQREELARNRKVEIVVKAKIRDFLTFMKWQLCWKKKKMKNKKKRKKKILTFTLL